MMKNIDPNTFIAETFIKIKYINYVIYLFVFLFSRQFLFSSFEYMDQYHCRMRFFYESPIAHDLLEPALDDLSFWELKCMTFVSNFKKFL